MRAAPPFSPDIDAPVCVALSGGMDSMALLHALAASPTHRARGLRALHVHHGLQPDADAWAAACADACARLGVALEVRRVDARDDRGLGPEGAAREARHAAFAASLRDGEHLALAHHRDDQAETVLLRALRGSGVDGLAAMAALRPIGRGVLWRPWLGVPRADIAAYARAAVPCWVDDPSNAALHLDRNFLRHRVLPLLRERWPQADAALAAVAAHAAEARALLESDDLLQLARATVAVPHTLSLAALRALDPARRARVLRAWVASTGLPPLPSRGIARIEQDLVHARADAHARFDWAGARIEAWRGLLHARRIVAPLPADWHGLWPGTATLALPDGGRLDLLPPAAFPSPVTVHARRGGERLRLPGRAHRHALKHLLQDAGVPPWEREHLPLLASADGTVLAAGDRIVSAPLRAWLDAAGTRLRWTPPA